MVAAGVVKGWYESLEEARQELRGKGLSVVGMDHRRAIFSEDTEGKTWSLIIISHEDSFVDSGHYDDIEEVLLALTRWVYQGLWP